MLDTAPGTRTVKNGDGNCSCSCPECCCIVHPGEARSREKLIGRFDQFATGHWGDLIDASHKCAQKAVTVLRRRQRRSTDPDAHRARRALQFVQLGELSSGRQALEGAELALGNRNTLDELRQRLDVPREPIFELPRDTPLFNLDEKMFNRNVRSAKKGAAAGSSGM